MARLSIREDRITEDPDESYRTCSICGGDCLPEPSGANGLGVRILWVCPDHGAQSITDPFTDLR